MKRVAVFLLVFALLILGNALLFSGGGSETETPAAEQKREEPPSISKIRVLKYTDMVTVDPAHLQWDTDIAIQVYQGMVQFDFTSEAPYPIVPVLAKSYEVSKDAKTITFKLHEGVQFHRDYGELTSEDIVFSLRRHQDPEVGSFVAQQFNDVERIEAVDRYTVRIVLKTPSAYSFLQNLAWKEAGYILSKKAVTELGEKANLLPVGTGPFYFDRWEPGQKVVLKKFDKFWGPPARVDEIEYWIIPEEIVGLGALEKGDIDIVPLQDPGSVIRAKDLENTNVVEAKGGGGRVYSYWINHKMKPMDDVRVRRALAHALDIKTICARIGPLTKPWSSPLAPIVFAATDEFWRYDYDLDKAKQLLAEAGYPNGFKLKVLYMKPSLGEPRILEVKSYWDKIVDVELELVDGPMYNQKVREYQHHIAQWERARFAPHHFAQLYLTGSAANYCQYSNPATDEAAQKATSALTEEDARKYWREFQRLLTDDVAHIWLASGTSLFAIRKGVEDVIPYPQPGYVSLQKAYVE